MLAAFSVAPSGSPTGGGTAASNSDGSVHDAVAAAVRVVRESGFPNHTDSNFTNIVNPGHGFFVRSSSI